MTTIDLKIVSYGAEHELADWPLAGGVPEGFGRDKKDTTIVNSNGIANDPTGKLYGFGGEINTPPTASIHGQIECLKDIKEYMPQAKVNYRSNLHLHVRVPGLQYNLPMLKQFQRHIHTYMPFVLPVIDPLPKPVNGMTPEAQGAVTRAKRNKVSHHTLLTQQRLQHQLAAPTLEEFFQREVPWSEKLGKPQWQCQPRLCVNLRQLLETDTIEFRHFPGTMDEEALFAAFTWVHMYTYCALRDEDPLDLLEQMENTIAKLPRFQPYNHWQEQRYQATYAGKPRAERKAAIEKFLEEDEHEHDVPVP